MGLADFAKQKLNETLDKKMQIEEDAAKFSSYVGQHADEIVEQVNKFGTSKLIDKGDVGIESNAKDVVKKLRHDENGAYVDTVQYRIYVQYHSFDGDYSRAFFVKRYTCVNGLGNNSVGASNSTFVGGNDDEDDDENALYNSLSESQRAEIEREEREERRREREEEREERRREREEEREERQRKKEKEKEIKKKVDEINNAPMPEVKDIIMEIKTCEQKSDNHSFSYEEQHAYESRAKLLKEYAKQKYANDPEVKAYLRKDTFHNKRFLIMWCVFLVAAVVVFVVCEEWWHYVLAVLGTVVVAVVFGLIHMANCD